MTTNTTTVPPAREQLEQEAAAAEQRAADLRARMRAEDEAAARRRREAQRKFDEDFVAGFSRSKIDADVDQARQALDAALAADPLVAALADYLTALRRRSHMLLEHSSTLSRLGRPSYTPKPRPTTETNGDRTVTKERDRGGGWTRRQPRSPDRREHSRCLRIPKRIALALGVTHRGC